MIKSYDVLMIDEVSMVNGEFFDRVSEHMSAVRQDSRPLAEWIVLLATSCSSDPSITRRHEKRVVLPSADSQQRICV